MAVSEPQERALSKAPGAGRVKGFWGGQAAVSEPQERALSKAPGAGKGEGLLGGPGGSLGTVRKSFEQSPGQDWFMVQRLERTAICKEP